MTTTNRGVVFLLWAATMVATVAAQQVPFSERLAKAALLETRGELAAAEQELRAALAAAPDSERAAIERALAALRQRSGAAVEPASSAPGRAVAPAPTAAEDPVVQRLISDLELGTEVVESVKAAREQLQSLGALAVPALCARLPQLGPFGITNAIGLLRSDDPAVVAVLVTLVERDAATAQLVVDRMDRLPYGSARALCERLVAPKFPVSVRTAALALLAQRGAEPAQLEPVVQALLAEPAAHGALVDVVRTLQVPWVVPVLVTLSASQNPWARAEALVARAKLEPELSEQAFLAALATIEVTPMQRAQFAREVVRVRPQWVEVACLGLPVASGSDLSAYRAVEWWRQPHAAAAALLTERQRASHDKVFHEQDCERIFASLIEGGWRIAPEHEELLLRQARVGFSPFVIAGALPDEERALAFYARMGPQWYGAVGNVVHRRLPWHRLVVRALGALPRTDSGSAANLLTRDWNGVSDEVAAELTAVIAKWIAAEPSVVNRKPGLQSGTATTTSSWIPPLIAAVRERGLPTSVLMPLVAAGSESALSALADLDPVAALELAMDDKFAIDAELFAHLARLHGSLRHVPRLLREWRAQRAASAASRPSNGSFERAATALVHALSHCGRGAVELIQLGTPDSWDWIVANAAANDARIEDLDRLLAMLPGLDRRIIVNVHEALTPQLGKQHAAQLLSALESVLPAVAAAPIAVPRSDEAPGAIVHAEYLLRHLDRLAVAELAPLAARIVIDAIGDTELIGLAARLALAHAGERRAEWLRSFLAHPRAMVVGIALQQVGDAEWAKFAEVATAAILRTGPQRSDVQALFDSLDRDARTALALAITGTPERRTFAPELLRTALGALTAGKDARHLAQIQAMADDPRADVRLKVAEALGMTFDRAAAPALLELLKDENDGVVEVAGRALKRLADYLQTRAEWETKLK
jgi:hypothetical protein